MKQYFIYAVIFFVIFGLIAPHLSLAAVPSDFGLVEGDVISASGSSDPDVYIVNEWGFKRLFVNPEIFNLYGHLGWNKIKPVSTTIRDAFVTSGLFQNCESNDPKVYGIDVVSEDIANLRWVNTTGAQAVADDQNFFKKVFCINNKEAALYGQGTEYSSVLQVPYYGRTVSGGSPPPITPRPARATSAFSDGTYIISSDVQPGTYRTRSNPLYYCSYKRLSGFGGSYDETIESELTSTTAIVTISPGDKGFASSGCGTWSPDLSRVTPSLSSFADGAYIVGTDVMPGTYRTSSNPLYYCSYKRLSGFGGSYDETIESELTSTTAIVTISPGDKGFASSGCGTWMLVGSQEPVGATWHQVYSTTGSNATIVKYLGELGPFTLKGSQFRVTTSCTPPIAPYNSGAIVPTIEVTNSLPPPPYNNVWQPAQGVLCPTGGALSIGVLAPGQYYLGGLVGPISYTITVEDYY